MERTLAIIKPDVVSLRKQGAVVQRILDEGKQAGERMRQGLLEQARGEDLLARIAVSDGCDAVLLGLEPGLRPFPSLRGGAGWCSR